MSRSTLTTISTAAAAGLVLLLGACGGDDDDASGSTPVEASGDTLQVIAEDIEFDADAYAVPAGPVDFVLENEGSIVHTLVIEGVDGFKLEVNRKGDVDEGSVELEPGEYVMYCDVPGHRSAGMEAALTVS